MDTPMESAWRAQQDDAQRRVRRWCVGSDRHRQPRRPRMRVFFMKLS